MQTGKRGEFGLGLERIAFSDREQFSFHLSLVIPTAALTPASASAGIFLLPRGVMESFQQPPLLALEQITCTVAFVGLGCRQVAVLAGTTNRGAGDSELH